MGTVLQTDFAWPDVEIERAVVEAAGHRLVTGSSVPPTADMVEHLVQAEVPDAIMTCWAQVSARAIALSPNLRIVQRIGVGLDNIDVAAATAHGAWVANVPDYCVGEVADHAVALLLDWARGTVTFDRAVKSGQWDPSGARLRRVSDLAVGIVGYGRIGRATAVRLKSFGCRLLVANRAPVEDQEVEQRALDDLLGAVDAVIVHAPLTAETHHLLDAARLRAMRPGAFLINVSRGPIVDTAALHAALESGHLSGAGLDVVEGEPDPPRALVDRPDVIVTPHVAFSSDASLAELRRRAAEEVVRVLAGEPPLNNCNRFEARA